MDKSDEIAKQFGLGKEETEQLEELNVLLLAQDVHQLAADLGGNKAEHDREIENSEGREEIILASASGKLRKAYMALLEDRQALLITQIDSDRP